MTSALNEKLKLLSLSIKKDTCVTSHTQKTKYVARNLTEDDVAIIKGMLLRGDKQQDIAAYYGINNGRISEINTRKKFPLIKPKHQDLPPVGSINYQRDTQSQNAEKNDVDYETVFNCCAEIETVIHPEGISVIAPILDKIICCVIPSNS